MAGPESPMVLHVYTPRMANAAATTLAGVTFCVTSRQMKMDVMAKEAMASGMPTALPTSTPATFDSAHELCEKRFTSVARPTDQPPSSNFAVFTP